MGIPRLFRLLSNTASNWHLRFYSSISAQLHLHFAQHDFTPRRTWKQWDISNSALKTIQVNKCWKSTFHCWMIIIMDIKLHDFSAGSGCWLLLHDNYHQWYLWGTQSWSEIALKFLTSMIINGLGFLSCSSASSNFKFGATHKHRFTS